MEQRNIRKPLCIFVVFICLAVLLSGLAAGCKSQKNAEEKIRDLEFTVVTQQEIPEELQKIIAQKEKEAFRFTYSSGTDLYIAAGYGEQKSSGYSISVPELYLTDHTIVIKTELMGPEQDEQTEWAVSYPYIVVKTEWIDCPVVFQ